MLGFDDSKMIPTQFRRPPKTIRKALIITALLLVVCLGQWAGLWNFNAAVSSSSAAIESQFGKPDVFHEAPVVGFANHRIPNGADCNDLRVEGVLGVTQSFHIEEDILDIATSADHPLIDYSEQKKGQSFRTMVEKTWAQMAGSSVWLEKHQVYLTATRVFFYDKGVKNWPVISFMRAQLHDANWNRLENYNLTWRGQQITFPRMLEVDTPYELGGGFYGPEDPRIIVEPGVEDPEPIVFFNMLSNLKTSVRSMHAFHPFSNFTTIFKIENYEVQGAEKNWAPFYLPKAKHESSKYPSQYIHFVYDLSPLRVLRCHLMNGFCKFVFVQPRPAAYRSEHGHNDTGGAMRGGTNFELLPPALQTRPGLLTYVGITRTHTDDGCGEADFYRPEIMLLTTDGTTYYLDYVSEAMMMFDEYFLTELQLANPCGQGRIFMANSIARVYDDKFGRNKDVMDVSWSVGDATVQFAKIRGVQALVAQLPQWHPGYNPITGASRRADDVVWANNVTSDVLDCSVRTSSDYALSVTPVEMKEAWEQKLKEDAEKKQKKIQEEERKKKAAQQEEEKKKKLEQGQQAT